MFVYEKKLQYPVRIANPNPKLAAVIISQYGGPDGELGASLRYLSQRYAMPYAELKGLLTDIGTEETAHMDAVDHPSETRVPVNALQQPSRCRRRHHIIADALRLHLRPREACVVTPNLHLDWHWITPLFPLALVLISV